jgi:NAD(P)-dependent dehydrogenase (short-subunit alcohol dehydrogenase family)
LRVYPNDMRLENKIAIVTESSRILGKAFASALTREGASVVITSRTLGAAQRTANEIGPRAFGVATDVSDEASITAMVREVLVRVGTIDILVNNAGIVTPFHEVVDLPVEEWDRTFSVNLRGTFLCCKTVLPTMIAQRYGKIINLGAGVLDERAHVGISPYCASKAGVINFTRQLAAEVRRYKINVNAIDPGAVRTGMAEGFEVSEETTRWLNLQQTVDQTYGARFRPPEDIAPLVVFLASDESRALNGRFLQVSSDAYPYYLQQ